MLQSKTVVNRTSANILGSEWMTNGHDLTSLLEEAKRKGIEDCGICKEIAKEVREQTTKEVEKEVTEAKVVIEKELLRQLVVRHESSLKEVEKTIETKISEDLES